MEQVFSDLLVQVFMLVGILLASFVMALLKKQFGTEKLKEIKAEFEAKKEIVNTAVLFVQQVYWAYDGDAKHTKAIERATIMMNEKGLTVSPEELEALLESGLRLLKKEFGDAWDKEVSSEEFESI